MLKVIHFVVFKVENLSFKSFVILWHETFSVIGSKPAFFELWKLDIHL